MKYMVTGLSLLLLVACAPQNEQYYRMNPEILRAALQKCPNQAPSGVSCDQLSSIAIKMNRLADEWRMGPQAFGKKIISLQNRLATLQDQSGNASVKANNETTIQTVSEELQERLAVVKWLSSPVS